MMSTVIFPGLGLFRRKEAAASIVRDSRWSLLPARGVTPRDLSTPEHATRSPRFLPQISGLRGLAILLVMTCYLRRVILTDASMQGASASIRNLLTWLLSGHIGLSIFVVLGGYLLARPLTSFGSQVAGGWGSFYSRRAWRYLLPYAAALLVSMGLVAICRSLGVRADDVLPWDGHPKSRLLIVALLASIVAAFPIFLSLWRQTGIATVLTLAISVGLATCVWTDTDSILPWLLPMFALGMTAAAIEAAIPSGDAKSRLFGWLTLGCFGSYLLTTFGLSLTHFQLSDLHGLFGAAAYGVLDLWIAAAAVSLVIWTSEDVHRPGLSRAILTSRFFMFAGGVSYSAYLLHLPLLELLRIPLARYGVGPWWQLATLGLIGLPIVLGVSWLFAAIFERPFRREWNSWLANEVLSSHRPPARLDI